MNRIKKLNVLFEGKRVGILAVTRDNRVAFEYDDNWLLNGFPLNPLSLPLNKQVFIPKYDPFAGLFGAFADSLPDGWGRLLVDRLLLREGEDPQAIDSINRLSIVGHSGLGALVYEPQFDLSDDKDGMDYDQLAEECHKLLMNDYSDHLDELFILGGSSGGARPKIMTVIDREPWIIKFPSSYDRADTGLLEYNYAQCAGLCGIEMMETRLFPSDHSAGYFGTKRFDRRNNPDGSIRRIHMMSVSALLETSHRIPNLDYNILMKLTLKLTQDMNEAEKLYRLMCFNVFAHNRDDHAKNFSFLFDDQLKRWKLAPAYDLTYSSSIGGEHATSINGNGRNPGLDDLLAVAESVKLGKEKSRRIALDIKEIVSSQLSVSN